MIKDTGIMRFEIPGMPPSVNSLYQINRRTMEFTLKPEAVLWRIQALPYLPKKVPGFIGQKLRFTMSVHRDWNFKNGKPLRADVANLEKLVHDTVARHMGFDDLWIWEKVSRKVQDVTWAGVKCEISIL